MPPWTHWLPLTSSPEECPSPEVPDSQGGTRPGSERGYLLPIGPLGLQVDRRIFRTAQPSGVTFESYSSLMS
jgi:hypothetical protein